MKTKYGIPQDQMDLIFKRDKNCAYCYKKMIYPFDRKNSKDSLTIEHLNHKQDWNSVESYLKNKKLVSEIIVLCCGNCNTSRGSKSLKKWFNTSYCKEKNINYNNVTKIV